MDSEPQLKIDARDILAKIEKGEGIDYSNVMIEGGLDLSGLDLKKDEEGKLLVASQIRIRNSIIQGIVKFDNAIFERLVDFEGTTFMLAGFRYAKFCKYAGFEDTTFSGYAAFEHVEFMGEANFSNAQFSDGADAYFCEAKFRDNAFFWSIRGKKITFSGDADFQHVLFYKLATFHRSKFLKKANFAFSRFNGEDAIFMNAQFEGVADFKGARIKGEIDFRDAQFNKNFDLRGARFTHFVVSLGSIKNRLVYDGPVFLALINSFKISEQFEDADDCYYQYRRKSQAEKKLYAWNGGMPVMNWSKLLDALAWISCGYGVRPKYTFFLSILLIIFFAGLFCTGNSIVVEQINSAAIGQHLAQGDQIHSLSFADHLYFSAMIFTTKTQVKWYPAGVYRYLAVVESILGWLLMALFLVTLGRTMIR